MVLINIIPYKPSLRGADSFITQKMLLKQISTSIWSANAGENIQETSPSAILSWTIFKHQNLVVILKLKAGDIPVPCFLTRLLIKRSLNNTFSDTNLTNFLCA